MVFLYDIRTVLEELTLINPLIVDRAEILPLHQVLDLGAHLLHVQHMLYEFQGCRFACCVYRVLKKCTWSLLSIFADGG